MLLHRKREDPDINDFRDVLVLAGAAAASAAFWNGFVEGAIAVFLEIAI